jgi:hypothetical protein
MSALQNPIRSQSVAVPAGLSRLLLVCRFDLQQRSWGLPAWGVRRDSHSIFPSDLAELASAISKNSSDFSDPSLGGAKPSKAAARRTGIRHFSRRLLGDNQTTKRKEK